MFEWQMHRDYLTIKIHVAAAYKRNLKIYVHVLFKLSYE